MTSLHVKSQKGFTLKLVLDTAWRSAEGAAERSREKMVARAAPAVFRVERERVGVVARVESLANASAMRTFTPGKATTRDS